MGEHIAGVDMLAQADIIEQRRENKDLKEKLAAYESALANIKASYDAALAEFSKVKDQRIERQDGGVPTVRETLVPKHGVAFAVGIALFVGLTVMGIGYVLLRGIP